MEVDVRTGSMAITDIRFSDTLKLTGGEDKQNVKVENAAGQANVICTKAEIPNLIKALQLAQKTWGA